MHNEIEKYSFRKKKKKSFLNKAGIKKIYFYRNPEELPDLINPDEYKRLYEKSKARLNKHKKAVYNGIIYHSSWEAEYAKELDLRKNAGDIKDWRRQVKIEINVLDNDNKPELTDRTMLELKKENKNAVHICNYYIDFVIVHNDNSLEYAEIKGARMELWKLKFRLFESIFKMLHPDIKITIIN